jgi:DNA-binding transcriptional regulator LsrR (DeoR family)
MARKDQVHLMAKIARMYYTQSMRQVQITQRLSIHQSTISRLLKKAQDTGMVRISVSTPPGVYPEIEDELEERFGLDQAVVVDCVSTNEEQIARDLGSAAAHLVESSVQAGQVIGISSWSRALLEMINSMQPTKDGTGTKVVQILGGLGDLSAQTNATFLTQRLAALLGGTPILLPAPGITRSADARRVLLREEYIREAVELFDKLDTILVGIGSVEPSKFLASSGNTFAKEELSQLAKKGAVGDICLRYFDSKGSMITSPLLDRVIGIKVNQIKAVKRVIAVAGGIRKLAAIRGVLKGRWVKVLVIDRTTAQAILDVSD